MEDTVLVCSSKQTENCRNATSLTDWEQQGNDQCNHVNCTKDSNWFINALQCVVYTTELNWFINVLQCVVYTTELNWFINVLQCVACTTESNWFNKGQVQGQG